jgi:hypothetical protein
MKKILLSLFVATSLIACNNQETKTETAAATTPATLDTATVAAKIKGMEAAWNLSILETDHGAKVVSEILADDFHQFNSKGEKQNKEEFIKSLSAQDGTITEVINGDMNVTFHGNNIATVLGSHVTKGTDKAGKAFSRTTTWNDTYVERDGKWQCVSSGGLNTEN